MSKKRTIHTDNSTSKRHKSLPMEKPEMRKQEATATTIINAMETETVETLSILQQQTSSMNDVKSDHDDDSQDNDSSSESEIDSAEKRKREIKKTYKQRYQQKKSIKRKVTKFVTTTGDRAFVIFVTKNSQRKNGLDIEFFNPSTNPTDPFTLYWLKERETLEKVIHQNGGNSKVDGNTHQVFSESTPSLSKMLEAVSQRQAPQLIPNITATTTNVNFNPSPPPSYFPAYYPHSTSLHPYPQQHMSMNGLYQAPYPFPYPSPVPANILC